MPIDRPWLIETVQDLERLIRRRRLSEEGHPIGVLLAIEGAHWLGNPGEDVSSAIEELYGTGFRMIALTHRFDNLLAGASEGCEKTGLTLRGQEVLRSLDAHRMVIDIAHLSNEAISDLAILNIGPVVASHGGVQASFDVPRNLSDSDIETVAKTDGVIGVGYWPEAVGPTGKYLEAIGAAFQATLGVLSNPVFRREMDRARLEAGGREYDPYEHITLGSDFDGAVLVPFTAEELVVLTSFLSRMENSEGELMFPREKLRLIAGQNACRVLASRLPSEVATRPKPESVCGLGVR